MPILLTTPLVYEPGHNQSAETYGELKIVKFSIDIEIKCLQLRMEYGDTDPGDAEATPPVAPFWKPGNVPDHHMVIEDREAHIGPGDTEIAADLAFSSLMATSVTQGAAGSNLYAEVGGSLYQYLIDVGHYAGTIT